MIPGEPLPQAGSVELNEGRDTLTLAVANTGDRPIQETYEVRLDGQLVTSEPAAELPLAQRYFLF